MANERLRDALLQVGLTPDDLAARLNVDPKTVERWITPGRTPYRRYRREIAGYVHAVESYLWPDATTAEQRSQTAEAEIIKVYPHRVDIAPDTWLRLFDSATDHIGVLVYVGYFLPEIDPKMMNLIRAKARTGVKIRFLFGDPDAPALAERGVQEGIGAEAVPAKARNVLALYERLRGTPGVEVRLHGTWLYNSLYWFDDEMIVNPHIYGEIAAHNPALHLRRLAAGDLFEMYARSFERVWDEATTLWPEGSA